MARNEELWKNPRNAKKSGNKCEKCLNSEEVAFAES